MYSGILCMDPIFKAQSFNHFGSVCNVHGKCLVKILCLWDNSTSCPSCPIMPSKCASKCAVGNGMCCACLWIFSWTVTSLLVNHKQTVFQVYTGTFHLKESWVGHGVVTCLSFAFVEECQILCLNTESVCGGGGVGVWKSETDWKCVVRRLILKSLQQHHLWEAG